MTRDAAVETNVVEQTIERERRYGGTEKKSSRLEGLRRSLCVTMRGVRRVRGGGVVWLYRLFVFPVFPPNREVVLL